MVAIVSINKLEFSRQGILFLWAGRKIFLGRAQNFPRLSAKRTKSNPNLRDSQYIKDFRWGECCPNTNPNTQPKTQPNTPPKRI